MNFRQQVLDTMKPYSSLLQDNYLIYKMAQITKHLNEKMVRDSTTIAALLVRNIPEMFINHVKNL